MDKGYIVLLISLVLLFTANLSLSQDLSPSQAISGSKMENQTIDAASISPSSQPNATPTAAIANINPTAHNNLRYIWTITGIENNPVTMALDQDGRDIFGRAKYEPDTGEPWNGVVAGIISGDEVYLVITALKGDDQVATVLDGIFADEAIRGRFFKTSEGKILGSGSFNAMWISPDLSSYTSVEIKKTKAEVEDQSASANAAVYANQISPQKTKYHDVHQDADRVLTGVGDISQIPIGMGGSGLP